MGSDLLELLIANSGLPENYVRTKFQTLLEQNGMNSETVTLEQIREVLASLLQDIILEDTAS